MQVVGEHVMRADRDQVWALLNNELVLAKCLPGCEQLTRTGPNEFHVALKIGLAAIKGNYQGRMLILDQQEPDSMTLKVETTGSGGFANVGGRIDLTDLGGSTKVSYSWEVQVGGPVAMVGQRVLGGVAKWLIGEFFNTAQKEIAAQG